MNLNDNLNKNLNKNLIERMLIWMNVSINDIYPDNDRSEKIRDRFEKIRKNNHYKLCYK